MKTCSPVMRECKEKNVGNQCCVWSSSAGSVSVEENHARKESHARKS